MLTQLCKTTHAKLLVGRCPWCGCPITEGQLVGVSWYAVQERIREVIDAENKSTPLTDLEIVEKLAAEGIQVGVRTIAKFRQKWQIPSAKKRRAED